MWYVSNISLKRSGNLVGSWSKMCKDQKNKFYVESYSFLIKEKEVQKAFLKVSNIQLTRTSQTKYMHFFMNS